MGTSVVKGYDFATETTQIMNNIELVVNAERQLQSLLNQAEMIENQIEGIKISCNLSSNRHGSNRRPKIAVV